MALLDERGGLDRPARLVRGRPCADYPDTSQADVYIGETKRAGLARPQPAQHHRQNDRPVANISYCPPADLP